ncbi:sigma-54-dependent Fis family transcriptional regulator, partial [Enterobacter mori]
ILFLDEIGDMPLPTQARLLRVLQTRSIQPLGSGAPVAVDIRGVSASNRDLAEEVRAGRVRQDLYYRIAGLAVVLPPLRER